jgi:hypothetical protein
MIDAAIKAQQHCDHGVIVVNGGGGHFVWPIDPDAYRKT